MSRLGLSNSESGQSVPAQNTLMGLWLSNPRIWLRIECGDRDRGGNATDTPNGPVLGSHRRARLGNAPRVRARASQLGGMGRTSTANTGEVGTGSGTEGAAKPTRSGVKAQASGDVGSLVPGGALNSGRADLGTSGITGVYAVWEYYGVPLRCYDRNTQCRGSSRMVIHGYFDWNVVAAR